MADPDDMVRRKAEDEPRWSMDSAPILVHVGSEEASKDFYIHENLLVAHSEFFKAALGKPWKEMKERCVNLPEEKAEKFAHFARFVYYGKLYVSSASGSEGTEHLRLANMWTMADRLQSITLKDAVADSICSIMKQRNLGSSKLHRIIYPASSKNAAIRVLITDWLYYGMPSTLLTTEQNPEWAEVWFDIVQQATRVRHRKDSATAPYMGDPELWCRYHEHGEGPCYRTLFK